MTVRRLRVIVTVAALALSARPATGQQRLEDAVEQARVAWLGHEVSLLVSRSDTVRLQLPGVAMSASVKPAQASRLLHKYLESSEELSFVLKDVRRLAPDHAYAEIARVFVVKGTSEKRSETVFLGFRVLGGEWRLREVRVTP